MELDREKPFRAPVGDGDGEGVEVALNWGGGERLSPWFNFHINSSFSMDSLLLTLLSRSYEARRCTCSVERCLFQEEQDIHIEAIFL